MRKRKWLGWIVVLGVTLSLGKAGFSRLLQSTAARRYLITRLEASFGRPVEVGKFDFSLLDGVRFEARPVTVSEDPAFGQEYFLRADSLTAGLRWSSLLSGRFEFDAVSLSRPSLNLVRDADGRWNIERWLPPAVPAALPPANANASRTPYRIAPARLYRMDVDGGRINFKQGDDKSSIALLDVAGSVEQDAPGRWRIDLEARPQRAGVELQDIGLLRLRGNIGGTSARLQPAQLNLTWTEVSVADAMRLWRQSDDGLRGQMAVDLSARVAASDATAEPLPNNLSDNSTVPRGAQWIISGVARLQGIHGWRLPGRITDAAVNLAVDAEWHLGDLHANIGKLQIEMPASNLHGAGDVDWSQGFHPQIHIESSSLGFADVLMWYRAFRPDVSDNLNFEGTLGVDVTLGGWPLQLEQGALASPGGRLTGSALPSPLRIGPMNAGVSHGGLDFAPTEISFQDVVPRAAAETPAADSEIPNTFALRGTVIPNAADTYRWPPIWSFSIEGHTSRIQDWLALSQVLAQPLAISWTAEGGLAAKLSGNHRSPSATTQWLGSVDLYDVTASLPFVNQPIRLSMPHLEFTKSQQTVTLFAAQAFGAMWHGTIARKIPAGQWTFDLSADRLDVAELDRWLGPRARPGLLTRVTGLGTAQADPSTVNMAAAAISARGHLRVDEIILAPLRLEQFGGEVELNGRTVTAHDVLADFYGGKAAGKFEAQLLPDPSYDFLGRFDRVDLSRLADAVPSLNDRISGTASAAVHFSAHGIGRPNLVSSMDGDGKLEVRNPEIRGLDFSRMISGGGPDASAARFVSAKGNFRVGSGGIDVADFLLDNSRNRFVAEGRVDFSQALNFQIRPVSTAARPPAKPSPAFLLRGTVDAPETVSSPSALKPAVRGRSGR